MSATLMHNSVYRSQSEAGPLANVLGSKERLEDFGARLAIHANTRVAHRQHNVAARKQRRLLARDAVIECHIFRFQRETTAARLPISGIDGQVHDPLLHPGRVAPPGPSL